MLFSCLLSHHYILAFPARRFFIWFKKVTPLSHLNWESLVRKRDITAKAELNCEIYRLYTKRWKHQVNLVTLKKVKKFALKTCGCA